MIPSESTEPLTPRKFRVDARVLLSLGRESIKDQSTALIELVKNAYDADAENVEIEIPKVGDPHQIIRVVDDGCGMNSDDVNERWLRIGFSHKRQSKLSANKNRRATGEKGVGRLSADRLGAQLELRSLSSKGAVGVLVNWDDFDADGVDLGAVAVHDLVDKNPQLPSHSRGGSTGTEIRISKLRQGWTDEDFRSLETELSTLVPPDSKRGGDFSIRIRRGSTEPLRLLEAPFAGESELELIGKFDRSGQLTYTISSKPMAGSAKRHSLKHGKAPWEQLTGSKGSPIYSLGTIEVELKFYLRSGIKVEGFSLGDLRDYLDSYGGVRIYRDFVRVKPYGDPVHAEGDWLGLSERKTRNPAAASRKDFRISGNQLVGGVYIGRDLNPLLRDSAAREGLVHGEGYAQLRSAVFSCINILETIYHERFAEAKATEGGVLEKLPTVVGDIKGGLQEMREQLATAGSESWKDNKATSRLLRDSVAKIESIAKQVEIAQRGIEELASQTTVYRGLATVGISSAVFGHETESALAQAKISNGLAFKALTRPAPKVDLSIAEIEKSGRAIDKVSVWGQFALARVKKDKRHRRKTDISHLISGLITEMVPLFDASSIEIRRNLITRLDARVFPMDLEALTLNLLTNAYYAAGKSKKNRAVEVTLSRLSLAGQPSVLLAVEDSGPGILKEHVKQIWTPLFSTRTDDRGRSTGTGLGLTIVKSVATELGGACTVVGSGKMGGARFEVSFPIRE